MPCPRLSLSPGLGLLAPRYVQLPGPGDPQEADSPTAQQVCVGLGRPRLSWSP